MTAQVDATFARLSRSRYFQLVREKDENVTVERNLRATPRELSRNLAHFDPLPDQSLIQ